MTTRTRNDIATTEATRYQVALTRGSDVLHVYGYTPRKSKQGLLSMATDDVTELLTEDELAQCDTFSLKYTRKFGLQVAENIFIRFTGVTERDSAL